MSAIHLKSYESEIEDPIKGPKITIGVFFDGTLNNEKNVKARKLAEGQKDIKEPDDLDEYLAANKKNGGPDTSYANEESNVSHLEKFYKTDEVEVFRIYVEGIGTGNLKGDGGGTVQQQEKVLVIME